MTRPSPRAERPVHYPGFGPRRGRLSACAAEGVNDTPGPVDIRKGSINVKNIIGRKVGMTSVFTEDGRSVPVPVIQAGPCTVVQKKTKETAGDESVALAFGDVKPSRLTKALQGHYKKAGL